MNDLLKKLQDLGLKVDRASNLAPVTRSTANVDDFVHGEWLESSGQRIFVVKRKYQFGTNHGNIILDWTVNDGWVNDFWQINGSANLRIQELIYLDTETSSLSIGAGALIFLFGCCYFVDDGLEILQVFIEDPSHESFFLTYIGNILEKFNCLVSYNGKSFDVPVLRSRHVLNRIPHLLDRFSHIDLLHIARRIWKYDLDSKKLSDIEAKVLQFKRGEDEIPGWLVPQIYQDYVQTGNAEMLQGVFYHNEIDVVSLAGLFLKIEQMLSTNDFAGNETLSLGEIFHHARMFATADEYFKMALENSPKDFFREKTLINLAYSLKKQKKLTEMCSVWEELAKAENLTACVELAKFYEHKEKDYVLALDWTKKAIQLAGKISLHDDRAPEELKNRKDRLMIKLRKAG